MHGHAHGSHALRRHGHVLLARVDVHSLGGPERDHGRHRRLVDGGPVYFPAILVVS
jgi:hypothetical protein